MAMNRQIQHYVASGYVFHGSVCDDIQVLVPHEPRDAGNDPKDKEVAVYATYDASKAVIFALIKGLQGKLEVEQSEGKTIAILPRSFAEQLQSNVGSLYVLRREDFSASDSWQLKSYRPVKPIDRLDVCLQDFIELGGKIVLR
jgi:hypothetical protein